MNLLTLFLCISIISISLSAKTEKNQTIFSIKKAMSQHNAKVKLGDDIELSFGVNPNIKVKKYLGSYIENKTNNSFNKSNLKSCELAFISALVSLRDRARNLGGHAVVNIKSVAIKANLVSEGKFECQTGNLMNQVTLSGDIVKL